MRSWRPAALAVIAIVAMGVGACKKTDAQPTPADAAPAAITKSPSAPTHLDDTARKVLDEIAKQETTRDVTCWTSFRQLDNFISSKEYSNFATLAKITAVKSVVRASWEKASRETAGAEVSAPELEKAAGLPAAGVEEKDKEGLAAFAKDLGMKAYKDYRTTSEHWRIVLSVIEDEIYAPGEIGLKPLAPEALNMLAEVATRASIALLKRAGLLSLEARTPFIEATEVKRAHSEIAAQYKLTNSPRAQTPLSYDDVGRRLAPLTTLLVEGKIKALQTYNKDTGDLTKDMARVAKLPIAPDALTPLVTELERFVKLASLGDALGENFDRRMSAPGTLPPDAGPPKNPFISAADAANGTTELFPHLILPNGDLMLHVEPGAEAQTGPGSKGRDVLIRDYEQNAIRDTAVHWIAMRNVGKTQPLAMDPFAAEYISEVASMMMTYILRNAEAEAKEQKLTEITRAVVLKRLVKGATLVPPSTREERARVWTDEDKKKKSVLLASYGGDGAQLFRPLAVSGLPLAVSATFSPAGFNFQSQAGGGIAVGDVDQDGYPDIYVAGQGLGRLFLNLGAAATPGGPRFRDVTAERGLPVIEDGTGALLFDMDGDGDLDLLLLESVSVSKIYAQGKDGRFTDASATTGIALHKGAHVASVFDYDRDGDLDIYVGYYGSDEWNRGGAGGPGAPRTPAQNTPSMDAHNGSPHELWRREANGRYTEVGKAAGVANTGWTLATGAFDFDNDGDLDLSVVNDFGADAFYKNKGDGTFEDISTVNGTADRGSGMNVSFADVNGDGWLDFYVSNIDMFSKQIKVVYPTDGTTLPNLDESLSKTFQYLSGNKLFINPADATGKKPFIAEQGKRFEPGDRGWAWAAVFFDYEADGDEDMYLSNGFIEGSYSANQKKQMFLSDGGTFYLAPPSSPEAVASNGRSVVPLDFDRDGDVDLILNNYRQPPVVLENIQKRGNHWLGIRLRGASPNTNAVGARVTVRAGGRTTLREVTCGEFYMGQREEVLAFGAGAEKTANVEIRWPNGKIQKLNDLPTDRAHEIKEAH